MEITVDTGGAVTIPKTGPAKQMISVEGSGSERLVKINSSSLDIIQNCMRKAYLRLDQKWVRREESPATLFGTGIHAALEIWYSGPVGQRTVPELEELELMSLGHEPRENTLSHLAAKACFDKIAPLRDLPEDDKRHPRNAAYILHKYFNNFREDPYVALEDERGKFLERTFEVPVRQGGRASIICFGTIDFAWRHIGNDTVIIGDHKTTSSLWGYSSGSYFDREKPNLQYSCYILGAREVFKLNVQNFMVNIIEVKPRPKTKAAKGPIFPRQVTVRTDADLQEFRETLCYFVDRYLDALDSGMWPLGPVGACNAYGSCEYRSVCSAPPNLRQNILENSFEREGTK